MTADPIFDDNQLGPIGSLGYTGPIQYLTNIINYISCGGHRSSIITADDWWTDEEDGYQVCIWSDNQAMQLVIMPQLYLKVTNDHTLIRLEHSRYNQSKWSDIIYNHLSTKYNGVDYNQWVEFGKYNTGGIRIEQILINIIEADKTIPPACRTEFYQPQPSVITNLLYYLGD